MPIPKPQLGEEDSDFLERCMINSMMVNEYPDEDQRFAVCEAQLESNDKNYKGMKFKTADRIKGIDEKKGIVEMVWSMMDVEDSDGDIIKSGAYKKTIDEKGPESSRPRIKWFKNHDPWDSPGKLLELYEDNKELVAVGQTVDTTLGRDTLIEIKEGIITEHSVGFDIPGGKAATRSEGGLEIKEVNLWEGSSLTHWGANEFTPVRDVKSKEGREVLVKQIERLQKAMKIKEFSDEKYIELHVEFQRLTNIIKSLIEEEPGDTTPTIVEPTDEELIEVFTKNLK